MARFGHIFTAVLAATTFAMPAMAQSPAYRAVPVTASAANVIADGVMWRCDTDGCVATKATSRPAIVCAQAVRKVGKLVSFSVGAQPFDDEALAKCNAKAKA